MAVDGGIPLEAAAEPQAARVIIVPVADDDPGEAVEADVQPLGVPEKDVRRAGVEEPAVPVGTLHEDRDAVFREAPVGRDGVVAQDRQLHRGTLLYVRPRAAARTAA